MKSVWIGFDPRETSAYAVAKHSARRHLIEPVPIYGVILDRLRLAGLYRRATTKRDGQLWDHISEAPMSTEFAISRFLVPHLAGKGLALFMDADVLVRSNLDKLFDAIDPRNAVTVVKHNHAPPEGMKMDGQKQTRYARKNWSSVMVFNCDHPANLRLTVDMVNNVPGRDLHAFSWLADDEIGELDPGWNWLVGHSDKSVDPKIVHFTDGIPTMPGYENCPYSYEWRQELASWAG